MYMVNDLHMSITSTIGERIDAIKALYSIKSDVELARTLGISKQRMYSWRRRGVWDATTVLAAFPALRQAWVESGEGDMSSKHAQLVLKIKALEELIEQKDNIIEEQAKHIKHLTSKITERL